MDWFRPSRLVALGILSLGLGVAALRASPGSRGVVAADHRLASQAGAEVLGAGGNAVDAAVAAALAAGVVQSASSGLGGGGFAVVVVPGEDPVVLDFREIAPGRAHRDVFLDGDGRVNPAASKVGGLAVGVPGEPAGLATLLERWGRLPRSQVAAPAIRYASEGFAVEEHLAESLARTRSAGVREEFGLSGQLAGAGDLVRRPHLAETLRLWSAEGVDGLYGGAYAEDLVATVRSTGGVLGTEDLAGYRVQERAPIVATYKGYTLITMPPPSSGGVVLAQMLGVLESVDLNALGHNSSEYVHRLAQTMAHAYADRAHHLGDPGYVDVPVERLLSEERREEILQAFDPSTTLPVTAYGALMAPPRDAGTQHISVVDSEGMAVALTTTINTSFGSGVVVRDRGVILNNEMDDFAAAPGVPNAFGLVGGEANAVAPGKRPLSSMTPTVVLDPDGRVVMSMGASGGSFIISSVMQVFLNLVEFHMTPEQAVSAPRVHHQWLPDALFVEPGLSEEVLESLRGRGYTVREQPGYSSCQVVLLGKEGLIGASDPRKGGQPAEAR